MSIRGTPMRLDSAGVLGVRTISAGAQLAATLARLGSARQSGDANEMRAALGAFETLRTTGINIPRAAEASSAAIRQLLVGDPEHRRQMQLRRSRGVRRLVRRLWDLMVVQSACRPGGGGAGRGAAMGEVSRQGYREVHARVAKALTPTGRWDESQSVALADRDWAEDQERYSGTSHVLVWLQLICERFRSGAAEAVARQGFEALFKRCEPSALSPQPSALSPEASWARWARVCRAAESWLAATCGVCTIMAWRLRTPVRGVKGWYRLDPAACHR
eukprot:COSAG01_NODE_959_length_12451_cov_18.389815_1_plen_275_part_00